MVQEGKSISEKLEDLIGCCPGTPCDHEDEQGQEKVDETKATCIIT